MAKAKESNKGDHAADSLPKCGIIMPISAIDGCSAEHWKEVLSILKEVATDAGFQPNLVSDADEIGIIQKRIIQNIYDNEIVICDVSCKNPNVMFELGMRLAFDKPTIIIKDDKTSYTFDTSVIEHLEYPRDQRFFKILAFKESLSKKLKATYEKSQNDPSYSPFLKNFGEYKVAHLDEREISSNEFIISKLSELSSEMIKIRNMIPSSYIHKLPKSIYLFDDKIREKLKAMVSDYLFNTDGIPLPIDNEKDANMVVGKVVSWLSNEMSFDLGDGDIFAIDEYIRSTFMR